MLLDVMFGSKAAWRILSVMMEAPGRPFSQAELYGWTGLGSSSMTRTLALLSHHGFITEERSLGKSHYRINNVHPMSGAVRELCDMERKHLNNLPWEIVMVLREFVRKTLDTLPAAQVILFGSQARRTAHPHSDIDLAVIVERDLETGELLKLTEICQDIEQRFKVKAQAHHFTEEQFSHKEDSLIRAIELEGIRLVRPRRS